MSGATDYRVPQAQAHRLTAKAERLYAESQRLFAMAHLHGEHREASLGHVKAAMERADGYDVMASELENELAEDAKQAF